MTLSSTEKREIRRFGLIAFIFFGFLFALGLWRQKIVPTSFFLLLSLLGLSIFLFPLPLSPLYNGWLKISHIIGRLITGLILILAYFLVITPAAWIKRLFGGRPIPIFPDKIRSSYWVSRSEPVQPKERFIKRY